MFFGIWSCLKQISFSHVVNISLNDKSIWIHETKVALANYFPHALWMFKLTWASGIVWILLPSSVSKHISLFVFLNKTLLPSYASEQINFCLCSGRISVWVLFILHLNRGKLSLWKSKTGFSVCVLLTILFVYKRKKNPKCFEWLYSYRNRVP